MARPEVPSKTALGTRLRELRRKLGDPERDVFAARLGVSKTTLGNYEKGDSEPTASVLNSYRHNFGANVLWILTGEGDMFSETAAVTEDVVMVKTPLYEVQATAGSGLIPKDDRLHYSVAFSRAFLRSIGAKPESCIMLEAKGESMLPTIPDGAFMIVDQSKTDIADDQVLAFHVGPGIKVKRANWRMDGSLELRSDNEQNGYPKEVIGKDIADELSILGHVLFLLRRA
ncbi:helix-turn-helix domain-containing protein [Agrobacterium rhizogenes]|uniref:S24 family peptidase n=1 Tax=Rhizobium rhizogenes TaxID=359 RepID=UPI0022B651B6|nr:S24 family peptidase [Rhizobium rhizogenes]MCZ7451010.1 helix-turn-helix domain-containing protein [Rhizobium rhizogenes]